VLAYVLAWFIVPEEPMARVVSEDNHV